MRLRHCPLFYVAAKDRFVFSNEIIEELENLVNNINQHPFKNLIAIIYYNLKVNRYLSRLPEGLLKRLKENYYGAIALDMKQRGWLENFIRKRLPKDITIILLKGSANWGTIYPVEAPRTGCDIDILVRDTDFDRVVEIIEKDGKKTILDESRVFSNKNAYEYAYIIDDYAISVEIHRRISYPYVGDVDYERLFESSKRHPYYKDKRVRILSEEERIINTVIHSLKHADITAHEIVDTYRIIHKYKIDVKDIIIAAVRYNVAEYCSLLLREVFRLVENDSETVYLKEIDKPMFNLKEHIFNMLHNSDKRINLRMRQILSLMLMDDPKNFVRFMLFYIGLRGKDIFYDYVGRLSGRKYA